MHFYQRRRPSPIKIVLRQAATPTAEEDAIESASSVGTTPGPDSPDSPSPTAGAFEGEEPEEDEPESPIESEAPEVSTGQPEATATSQTGADAPGASSTVGPNATSAISGSSSAAGTAANTATSRAQGTQAASSTAASQSSITSASASRQPAVGTDAVPTLMTTTRPNADPSSSVFDEATSQITSTVTVPPSSAQSEVAGNGQPQKSTQNKGAFGGMGKGAEAALITLIILGGLALIVGAVFFLRKKRRTKHEHGMRHAEDAFDPGNSGSLHAPETVHTATSHFTQSSTNSLFAPGPYERPETVSTEQARSRISPPQPTPNPFADPPLNKAYDVLRGRPRSTTLTDRGSWVANPFKDPVSDRFDPFGELQQKAKQERARYLREVQREQEVLEKQRLGLRLGVGDVRKGSGATVEGLGVLDRSGGGQFPR